MNPDVGQIHREWFERDGVASLRQLGFAPGQRVIDFGSGPGRFTAPLSRIVGPGGGCVIAIDRSADGMERLRQRVRAHGRESAVEAVLADDGDGFSAMAVGPVDAVLAFDVLQHVKDREGFFGAVWEALRPGGVFYVYPAAVPHPGRIDMDAVRAALARHAFREAGRRRIRLPHAGNMVTDDVYLFARCEGA